MALPDAASASPRRRGAARDAGVACDDAEFRRRQRFHDAAEVPGAMTTTRAMPTRRSWSAWGHGHDEPPAPTPPAPPRVGVRCCDDESDEDGEGDVDGVRHGNGVSGEAAKHRRCLDSR
jgi:hypothetical protein